MPEMVHWSAGERPHHGEHHQGRAERQFPPQHVIKLQEVNKQQIAQMRDDIYEKLKDLMDKRSGDFRVAEDAAKKLFNLLDKRQANPADRLEAGQELQKKLNALIKRLDVVLRPIQKLIDKDAALRAGIELETRQRQQTERLQALQDFLEKIFEDALIGGKGKKKEQ